MSWNSNDATTEEIEYWRSVDIRWAIYECSENYSSAGPKPATPERLEAACKACFKKPLRLVTKRHHDRLEEDMMIYAFTGKILSVKKTPLSIPVTVWEVD